MKDIVLVGSRALAFRAPRLLLRDPVDFDFVCSEAVARAWLRDNAAKAGTKLVRREGNKLLAEGEVNVEFELVDLSPSGGLLFEIVARDPQTLATPFGLVPSLDLLFMLKTSHRYLKNSPHFWKTAADWHRMRAAGCRVRDVHRDLLRLREKETYNYSHPRLNRSKMSFFADDAIQYVYDHDTIHEAVAIGSRPAYRDFQKDGAEVATDKAKFFACPREVQLRSVCEESAVLAIERSLVPHHGAWTPLQAWRFALSKVCTSITSGWWREFAYENLPEVLKAYPADYYDKFLRGVESGLVRPFAKSASPADATSPSSR